MSKTTKFKILWAIMFGITMGYFEASVVVYLRQVYSIGDSLFPVKFLVNKLAFVEVGREAFSLLMLLSVGFIAGRSIKEKIAYFFFLFGVWDICYYVFLKIILGWPSSLCTWDILFLIPCVWTGPVIAPVIVSITFIVIGFLIIDMEEKGDFFEQGQLCFWLQVVAGLIIVLAFIWDFQNIHAGGLPNPFRWDIFILGEILLVIIFSYFYKKCKVCKI